MRRAERLELASGPVFATVHLAPPRARRGSIVVLLNAGQVPRDGHGGLSAKVADACANAGFEAWRVDLPGLGDSPGPLPQKAETFWRMVDRGGQRETVLSVLDAIAERTGQGAFYVGGLCGAAVNAIYAAARRGSRFRGLILWEPELFVAPLESEVENASPHTLVRWAGKLTSRAAWTRVLTGETDLRVPFRRVRRRLIPLLLRSKNLPENANLDLAAELGRIGRRGLPCLVINAAGHLRDVTARQVFESLFGSVSLPWLSWHSLEATNHIFTTGDAMSEVARLTTEWLGSVETQPRVVREGTRAPLASSQAAG